MRKQHTSSKSKTFHKDDHYGPLIEFVMQEVKTYDVFPQGTNWIGGEPVPFDPECLLAQKYIVTITKVF